MRDLHNKTVVITGATGGLGKAMCEKFGQAGARIAALDLEESALNSLQKQATRNGIEMMTVACDLRDESGSQAAIEVVQQAWGGIDMLINNAGITQIGAFRNSEPAAIRKIMQVNFFGAVAVTHAALDSIIERQGTIVAISSVAGFAPLIGRTGYSASKHAMNGFFETLRTELVDLGVKVVIVCPSFIGTGFGESSKKQKETVGKVATAEEVTEKIFKAVSKQKRMLITGHTGKLTFLLKKIAPGFYDKLMIKKLKSAAA